MPITIEAPNGTTKMYIVRYRLPGKNYSNQVDEASSLPVGDGVYEEVKVVPGSPFVLPEGAELIEVKVSSGSSRLDDSAQRTVRTWKFIPAKRGGTPVESWVQVPIIFRLED